MKFLLIVLILKFALAYNNGVSKTPPMGWNSWNLFGCDINEGLILETIDAMSAKLKKFGYQYVNIDDCWSLKSNRDPITNELIPDPTRFPRGIKFLADHAHSNGLKLGIYSDVGYKTCDGYPGSAGYYEIDAKTFANWGIDYLKFDYCNTDKDIEAAPWKYYGQMSKALNSTGRPIFFSICNWGVKSPHTWAPEIANSWRTTYDIAPKWESVISIIDQNKPLVPFSGPFSFNDPDMLEVDVNRAPDMLTVNEARTHFTMWCMLNSPLLLGNDIRKIDLDEKKWVKDILTNQEVIAINQDGFVKQAKLMYDIKNGTFDDKGGCTSTNCTWIEVWMKPLQKTQTIAVAVFNRAGLVVKNPNFKSEIVTISWKGLGLEDDTKLFVRDLWAGSSKGLQQKQYVTDSIAPHDVRLYTFSGSQ